MTELFKNRKSRIKHMLFIFLVFTIKLAGNHDLCYRCSVFQSISLLTVRSPKLPLNNYHIMTNLQRDPNHHMRIDTHLTTVSK